MTATDSNPSMDTRGHFLQALRRVLRPIVRLMIRSGIRYDEFADVARRAYVESAIRDSDAHVLRPTRDQVAWMTGINRERIDHYIQSDGAIASVEPVPTRVVAEVLHKWHTDPQYLGSSAAPLELEFDAPVGPSFRRLVGQVDAHAEPEVILEKLLQARSVSRMEDGRIRAVSRCFIWPEEVISRIEYWGATLAHMIETLEHNLSSSSAENKRLERSVFADRGLPEQLLPDFHAFTLECANEFLSDLDNWLGQDAYVSECEAGPTVEMGLNVFFFLESPSDLTPLTALVQTRRKSASSDSGNGQ